MTSITRRPRRALALPAAIAILAGAGATTAGLLSPQRASAVTCPVLAANPTTYATPGENCFTVPSGVTVIHAVLTGATGGDGLTGTGGVTAGIGGAGGHGMQVTGDVTVTGGQVIWVYVGGNGSAGGTTFTSGAGGLNGGAHGGGNGDGANYAGGGGGATDLRTTEATTPFTNCGGDFGNDGNLAAGAPSSFILVAGGGGGGGNGSDAPLLIASQTAASLTPDGGAGGSQPGASSPPSAGTAGSPAGGGGGGAGTSVAGGAGGLGADGGGPGSAGTTRNTVNNSGCGGKGGLPQFNDGQSSGGGGGGGYQGGGGGGGGGDCLTLGACLPPASGITHTAPVAQGGGGGGGGGGDFHSSAVSGYAEAIDAPGPSAVISFSVATPTPTASVAPISVPATGSDGAPTAGVGIALLGLGAFLMGTLAIARRRTGRRGEPRSPA
jgi:hypothetical protein